MLDFENVDLVAFVSFVVTEKLNACKIIMLVVGTNFAILKNYVSKDDECHKYYHIVKEFPFIH